MRRAPHRARRRSGLALDSIAGWLFADLLLVMFLVGVGTEMTRTSQSEADPQATINTLQGKLDKANDKIEEQKTTLRKLSKKGMQEVPICVNVAVNPQELLAKDDDYDAALAKKLAKKLAKYEDELAGMVLIWGYAGDYARGQAIAEQVRAPLRTALPDTFKDSALRPLWRRGAAGKVQLEMFFYGDVTGPRC